ncbi:hypothetical protein pipiens_016135 [Culex pipiens pipiens]|uniref:Ferritin n=1 Tax=Culex pipiens pipiens TaxID=38569 RepID=A0ABD1CMP7_CULPP
MSNRSNHILFCLLPSAIKISVGTETTIYPSPWPVQPPGLHFLTCRCCYQEPAMAHQTGVELEREYVWDDLHRSCVDALHALIVYLKYTAYFAQEKINQPGFEKFFFHAAGEEREHGIKLIEYALMCRKEPVNKNTFQLDYSYKVPAATTELSALEDALKKEQEVTLSIRNLMKTCEGDKNDYHLVDYLTGEYLDEQHKGQRELAEKIATLRKMTGIDDASKEGRKLAEFLFDKDHMIGNYQAVEIKS